MASLGRPGPEGPTLLVDRWLGRGSQLFLDLLLVAAQVDQLFSAVPRHRSGPLLRSASAFGAGFLVQVGDGIRESLQMALEASDQAGSVVPGEVFAR